LRIKFVGKFDFHQPAPSSFAIGFFKEVSPRMIRRAFLGVTLATFAALSSAQGLSETEEDYITATVGAEFLFFVCNDYLPDAKRLLTVGAMKFGQERSDKITKAVTAEMIEILRGGSAKGTPAPAGDFDPEISAFVKKQLATLVKGNKASSFFCDDLGEIMIKKGYALRAH
jgi:hypothetical protein